MYRDDKGGFRQSDMHVNLTIISSDNGLSPGRRQAIILTSDGILLNVLIEIHTCTCPWKYRLRNGGGYFVQEEMS